MSGKRHTSSTAIADRLTKKITKEVPEVRLAIFGPPPVSGLGSGGGFKFIVEDRGENDLKRLQDETERMVALENRAAEINPDGRPRNVRRRPVSQSPTGTTKASRSKV